MPLNVSQNPFIIRPEPDLLDKHPVLKRNAHTLARAYAAHALVTEEDLQAMGSSLWHALAVDEPFASAQQAVGNLILPILIESEQAAIQQLPWETLYHPEHGFLGLSPKFTLARQLGQEVTESPPLQSGPLRVLLFTSLPDDLDGDTSRLDVEDQQAQVLEALTPAISTGVVTLKMPDDGRFSTLRSLLKTFAPHLLFLFGHGKFYPQTASDDPPYAIFQFENDTGGSDRVAETEIADAFVGSSVQCVVLSACESGMTSSDALNNGLSWRLSQAGVPHVIGMRESILQRAGILFNRALGDALARQERIDVALQAARQAITTPLKDSPWLKTDAQGLGTQSLGQWCLPTLITHNAQQPLIDWEFTPQPPQKQVSNATLQQINLPPRFLGRRTELRTLKSDFATGRRQQLLLTGPGGQGKTALAGKLAQDLQKQGVTVLAWSARPENRWEDFLLELELQLNANNAEKYSRLVDRYEEEVDKARLLLRLLLAQVGGHLLLFLDNLESLQDPATLALTDGRVQAWIAAGQSLLGQGMLLLLTSRWQLPHWPAADYWPLGHASYGDFLQMALQQQLPPTFWQKRERLHHVYETLHGNGRGLQFFAAATQTMATAAEEALFLQSLAQASVETQTDMAIAAVVDHLTAAEKTLLYRLPVYQTPVPEEGLIKLGLDLERAETLLQRLLAVSLLERTIAPRWDVYEYQLSPLLGAWLQTTGVPKAELRFWQDAATYQQYLFTHERHTLPQAIVTHKALQLAGEQEAANRLALDVIVGRLSMKGLYKTLLDEWLLPICDSTDAQTKAQALGQTGKQYHHLANYDTALDFLQQSLKISQEIGDKSGEGTTLNNISQIFDARGDYDSALDFLQQSLKISQEIGDKSGEGTTLNNMATTAHARGDYDTALDFLQQSLKIRQEIGDVAGLCATLFNMGHIYRQADQQGEALSAWLTVYELATKINLAQALQALEGLAGQIGLEGGLAGWQALWEAQQQKRP